MATISLTLPQSGTVVTAGLHSSNYGTLQSTINGGLDNNNFSTGKIFDTSKLMQNGALDQQVLKWTTSGSQWAPAFPPGYELAYTEFTGDVTSTVTTAAAAVSVASTTVTLDGSAVWAEFYAPSSLHTSAGAAGIWDLWDGSSDLGVIAQEILQTSAGFAISVRRKIAAPSAGSHTFSIRQWCGTAGTLTTKAASGGAGNYLPGFIRIVKA